MSRIAFRFSDLIRFFKNLQLRSGKGIVLAAFYFSCTVPDLTGNSDSSRVSNLAKSVFSIMGLSGGDENSIPPVDPNAPECVLGTDALGSCKLH
ncbi:hypothetical protein [Leptospira wolffii]|uniref:hypothetical protein n=1 Tax=Leptospira wolffii TaxID=409998 RepID=UPI0002FD3FFE|nr:hypothetical protein [Leptospira wolffii]EPG67485.1 hypothetical protein LEP1GSC061_0359 [Leptospira wolffii serovar Khorat str. Khorat-H2]